MPPITFEMRFDDVADFQPSLPGFLEIEVDVTLRIHHSGFPAASDEIGRMGQATKVVLLEIHLASPEWKEVAKFWKFNSINRDRLLKN
jgi:hypothetical protein